MLIYSGSTFVPEAQHNQDKESLANINEPRNLSTGPIINSPRLNIVGENQHTSIVPSLSPDNNSEYNFENLLQDQIEMIYERSFNTLDWVYKSYYKKSVEFKKLRLELNENMIEYRFHVYAGL